MRHEFIAGRVLVRIGRVPTRSLKKARSRAVDVVFPRREHADMPPLAHSMANLRPGFEHDGLQVAFNRVSCGSQANRSPADDRDGLRFCFHVIYPSRMIEI